ncbi:hypothetical protein [Paenibacillus sp. GCM10012303]|jgi:hypothetical protein
MVDELINIRGNRLYVEHAGLQAFFCNGSKGGIDIHQNTRGQDDLS